MYEYVIGIMEALEYFDYAIVIVLDPSTLLLWECPGKKGAKCFLTPIGPKPGPPPPWGIANVLCKFKWQTSAPKKPGEVKPT